MSDDTQNTQAQGTDTNTAAPETPVLDERAAKLAEQDQASVSKIVSLAVDTLDPKDMLRKYAKLGEAVLKHARWQKSKFPAYEKQDYERLCKNLGEQVRFMVPIKDIRMDVYVRVHAWVEAVKLIVPDVEKLSYHVVANVFLPTIKFDPVDLTAEFQDGWAVWTAEAVARQLGNDPLTLDGLKKSYAERAAEIKRERDDKLSPEKLAERERKAVEQKALAERRSAQSKISDSIDKALEHGHANGLDLMQIVEKIAGERGVAVPTVGFDPSTATKADCKMLASALWNAGKVVEMKYLRDQLDMMVKMFENSAVEAKTG